MNRPENLPNKTLVELFNSGEIHRRAIQIALDRDDASDRIIDIVGDRKWEPEYIESMGVHVKYKLIEQFEEQAELELRRECGV